MSDEKLTRKEAKERTRLRLIEAVLSHVREHGMSGLTTGRVAEAAGIAQSSFYVHFKDMDEALKAAADKTGQEMRSQLSAQRPPGGNLRAAYEGTLRALLAYPQITDLLLSRRRDKNSPLGETLRDLVAEAREDLIRDIKRNLGDSVGSFEIEAEFIVGLTLVALEGVLDGRIPSIEACLDPMVAMTAALTTNSLANR